MGIGRFFLRASLPSGCLENTNYGPEMKAWFVAAALVLTDECYAGASNVKEQQRVLSKLLDAIGPANLPLDGAYFAVRDEMAPKNSTLYRFNLTEGRLLDMHARLKPTVREDCCVQVDRFVRQLNARCDFNLIGMEINYSGALSYGAKIVQNFTVRARIKPHSFGNNPALLLIYLREKSGCKTTKCELAFRDDSVFITAFELNTTTSPGFVFFKSNKFDKFEKDTKLAQRIWEDFNVKMYTDVLPKVVKAIKEVYNKELPARVADLGPLEKKLFL